MHGILYVGLQYEIRVVHFTSELNKNIQYSRVVAKFYSTL